MTPLFKKLNFKQHMHALVLHAPDSFAPELEQMSEHAAFALNVLQLPRIDFALVFVRMQAEIDTAVAALANKLDGDAVLWFCYPKGSSKKYTCDFNRDTGWTALGAHNLEPVRQVAIDEDWSALRFRKVDYIKTMTRSEKHALSVMGREGVLGNS